MQFALQVMGCLVEHNLIHRGLAPLAMRGSIPVAQAILAADSAERVTVLLESAISDFNNLNSNDTAEDGEFLFKTAQLLNAG